LPQAKRSTTTRVASKFKQPAALKRLTTSLDNAQKALGELSKGSGREVSKGAKDIYADLRKFVSDAGKESTKVGKALQREFDQAQKLARANKSSASTRSTSSRSTAKRSTAKPSTAKRSTASRSASRSTTSRSAASSGRSTTRSTTRRASSGTAKRSSGGASRRGTSKS
jgi:hypothetical protein